MARLVATVVLATALVICPAAAHGAGKAHSAASRTVKVKKSVSGAGAYTASVSIKRPKRGSSQVRIRVENSAARKFKIRAKRGTRRETVKLEATVSDGSLNLTAIGQKGKPSLRISLKKKPASTQPKLMTFRQPSLPVPQRLVWNDEFDGAVSAPPAAGKWAMDSGGHGWGNNELQAFTNRPQNVSLDGAGNLSITARAERYTGSDGYTRDYTSGRLQTKGKFSMTYGRLEARVRVPAGRGLWSCVWMMGDDIWEAGWPNAGEIDVLEVLGHDTRTGYGSAHGPIGTSQTPWGISNEFTMATPLSDGYHDFGIIWTADAVEYTVDGLAYARIDRSSLPAGARWVFDHGFHPILSLAVGGNWPGNPDASTHFPATMSVASIRAYN